MYPLLCRGGYGVPIRAGKFEIIHITAAGSDTSATSRLTLLDDSSLASTDKWGKFVTTKTKVHDQIIDLKRVAVCEPNITFEPVESMKVRNGISVLNATNLEPGSILVYVR